jgi:hypothetical protein
VLKTKPIFSATLKNALSYYNVGVAVVNPEAVGLVPGLGNIYSTVTSRQKQLLSRKNKAEYESVSRRFVDAQHTDRQNVDNQISDNKHGDNTLN